MTRTFALALCASLCLGAAAEAQSLKAPVALTATSPLPSGVKLTEARWYSEQVEVSGRLFTPANFSGTSNARAVVLAPAWGQTAQSLDAYAEALAAKGIVALAVDYRGWGRSGGFIYLNERLDTYDKLRFSDRTPKLIIRRGRLEPELQIQDVRNAITYLDSIPGVDRGKIGMVGVDMAGGHVISVLGMDARVKAGVAVTPIIAGKGVEQKSYIPSAATRADMIRLARNGAPPTTPEAAKARNALESRIAVAEYRPFWRLDAIPATDAVQFIVAGADEKVKTADNAQAAADALKGSKDVHVIAGAKHALTAAQTAEAARTAADWLASKL